MLQVASQERHRLDAHAEDQRLLRRYVEFASQDAFSQIVARHLPWVYSICRKSLRDKHMADDAAQAVFIVLARRAAELPPEVRLSGWLFNTARFVVKDAKKQNARRKRREDVAREMYTQRFFATPKAPVDSHTQAALDQALHTLNDRDRAALLMHFYEGMSLGEMADALSISRDGAKKRVARALSRLRERLGKGKKLIPIAALALLLRGQSAQAMPYGLAGEIVNAALTPGMASGAAQALAKAAMSLAARAAQRLLRALLALEVAAAITLLVYVALPSRPASTGHRAVESAQAQPITSRAVTARSTAALLPPPTYDDASTDPPYRSGANDPEPTVQPLTPSTPAARKESTDVAALSASSDSFFTPGSTYANVAPVTAAPAPAFILPAPFEKPAPLSTQLNHTPARKPSDDRGDSVINLAAVLTPSPVTASRPIKRSLDTHTSNPGEPCDNTPQASTPPTPVFTPSPDTASAPPSLVHLIDHAVRERPDLQEEFDQVAANLPSDLFERPGHIKRGWDGSTRPDWLGEGAEPDRKPRRHADKGEKLIRWFKRTGWFDSGASLETLSPEELLELLRKLPLASNMDAQGAQWPCTQRNPWDQRRAHQAESFATPTAAPVAFASVPEPTTLLPLAALTLLLRRPRRKNIAPH